MGLGIYRSGSYLIILDLEVRHPTPSKELVIMANAIIKKAYDQILTLGIDTLDKRYVAVDPNLMS